MHKIFPVSLPLIPYRFIGPQIISVQKHKASFPLSGFDHSGFREDLQGFPYRNPAHGRGFDKLFFAGQHITPAVNAPDYQFLYLLRYLFGKLFIGNLL
jgi:hypothetical protein